VVAVAEETLDSSPSVLRTLAGIAAGVAAAVVVIALAIVLGMVATEGAAAAESLWMLPLFLSVAATFATLYFLAAWFVSGRSERPRHTLTVCAVAIGVAAGLWSSLGVADYSDGVAGVIGIVVATVLTFVVALVVGSEALLHVGRKLPFTLPAPPAPSAAE
jgi:hypothetical protein